METMMFTKNKRSVLSNEDSNSLVLFKCDGCNLNKSILIVYSDKRERGYLCEYCTKSNLFSSDSK